MNALLYNSNHNNNINRGGGGGEGWRGFKLGRTGRALRFASNINCELQLKPQLFTPNLRMDAQKNASGFIESQQTPTNNISIRSPLGGGSWLLNATIHLLTVFRGCDSNFLYDASLNPRRVLTKPHRPFHNNGLDNEKWDYILHVNDIIGDEDGRKFLVLDLLGHGTFGQVCKCQNVKTKELVAVKVIKNQPAYFNQSMMEVHILELLNQQFDPVDQRHIIRMRDAFVFQFHLCIVVELLSLNLYELIKQNQYRGFSLGLIRILLAQTLDALQVMKDAKIVHCDLKPENILLVSVDSPAIKVIDFGSACHENQTLYTYIQSRFYRSPEVLMGLPYSAAIDMWSLGCISAELFLGLPLFPGASNYDQLSRMVECLGIPPLHMLELGKDARLYFDKNVSERSFTLKSRERYSLERGRPEAPSKRYFTAIHLSDLIFTYPVRPKDLSGAELDAEMQGRRCFLDFLRGLLMYNPLERWTPSQATLHPFITGRTWDGYPFDPLSYMASVTSPIYLQPPGMRGRSNTLGSLSRQNVPAPLQRAGAAVAEEPGPVPSERKLPDQIPISNNNNNHMHQGVNTSTGQGGYGSGEIVGSVDTFTLIQGNQGFIGPRKSYFPVTEVLRNQAIGGMAGPSMMTGVPVGSLPTAQNEFNNPMIIKPSSGGGGGGRRQSATGSGQPMAQPSGTSDYVSSPLGQGASPTLVGSSSRRASTGEIPSPAKEVQIPANESHRQLNRRQSYSSAAVGTKKINMPSSPPSTSGGPQLMAIDEEKRGDLTTMTQTKETTFSQDQDKEELFAEPMMVSEANANELLGLNSDDATDNNDNDNNHNNNNNNNRGTLSSSSSNVGYKGGGTAGQRRKRSKP